MQSIALSGKSGSGKTTVASYLEQSHGYARVGTGDLCRAVCRELFGNESKMTMNAATDALRTVQPDVWLAAALRHAPRGRPLIVDSMRFREDYLLLRSRGYELWRVDVRSDVRWARLHQRGQESRGERDDGAAAETELDAAAFDQLIVNERGLPQLWEQVEATLWSRSRHRDPSTAVVPGAAP